MANETMNLNTPILTLDPYFPRHSNHMNFREDMAIYSICVQNLHSVPKSEMTYHRYHTVQKLHSVPSKTALALCKNCTRRGLTLCKICTAKKYFMLVSHCLKGGHDEDF